MMSAHLTPAAERMRRHRERRREGMRCLWIELRKTEIAALMRKGLLKPETGHDQNAIADACLEPCRVRLKILCARSFAADDEHAVHRGEAYRDRRLVGRRFVPGLG